MPIDNLGKIALLWRGDRDARAKTTSLNNRLRPMFEALAELNVDAEPVVYSDEAVDEARDQLLRLDGVLVWVDPISEGHDRSRLDPMLREVAAEGVWVSAHPEVILKMGTKEVLFRTRQLGWGTDTRIYRTLEELKEQFPPRLASGPRVLKQNRGNGGIGTWKVELGAGASVTAGADTIVHVLHARRGSVEEDLPLGEFLSRCDQYFAGHGCMIDQPFQPRLPDGMIRCYMVIDEVAGFGHQLIKALMPSPAGTEPAQPGPRIMYGASEPAFQALRRKMESEWTPAMMRMLGIERASLPVIWDADFLYGPKTESGDDTYVLCEINVSAVFPFPDYAITKIAQATATRLRSARATAPAKDRGGFV
ncbi:MAG TPA: Cj0069 family protein [Candidatus Binataceae bacterium]|nr:Cj0069 family protein [Candidatus Binataceae bacterium]